MHKRVSKEESIIFDHTAINHIIIINHVVKLTTLKKESPKFDEKVTEIVTTCYFFINDKNLLLKNNNDNKLYTFQKKEL